MFLCYVASVGWLWLSLVSAGHRRYPATAKLSGLNAALKFKIKIRFLFVHSRQEVLVSSMKMRSTHQSWGEGGVLEPSLEWSGLPGWRGSERASRRPRVRLTPASLSRWTSRERLPPLSSNRSSVSSSLCRREEEKVERRGSENCDQSFQSILSQCWLIVLRVIINVRRSTRLTWFSIGSGSSPLPWLRPLAGPLSGWPNDPLHDLISCVICAVHWVVIGRTPRGNTP